MNTLCPVTLGSTLSKDVTGKPYQMASEIQIPFAVFFDLWSVINNCKNYWKKLVGYGFFLLISWYILLVITYFFFSIYFWPHCMASGTSPTRDQTCAPCIGSKES